jgi:two-component system, NtrC family, C4-dicarboxylate transport sensor histidine kinase DctB
MKTLGFAAATPAGAKPSPPHRVSWLWRAAPAPLLLALLGMLLAYRWTESVGLERVAELAVERLELYAAALESELGRLDHVPGLVALDGDALAALTQADATARERASRRLAQINARVGSLLIFLTDTEGAMAASSHALPPEPAEQQRLEAIAHRLQTGGTGFFLAADGTTDYFHARPLLRDGKTLGQVVVRINLAPLEATWINLGARTRSERLLVLDPSDVAILSSVPAWKSLRVSANDGREPAALEDLRYQGRPLSTLLLSERGSPVHGAQMLNVREPESGVEFMLLCQERPVTGLGLRLLTFSDPADVRRGAGLAAWGGAAAGALVGLAGVYGLYRRRMLAKLLAARNSLQQARDELEQLVQERTRELTNTNAELKRQIEQRLRAEGELVQAGKMAVLGQMSAGVAHEVNQPLTALRALSGNALQLLDAGRQEDVRRNLHAIEGAVARVSRISSQLKSFARRGDGGLENVRLAAAVANCRVLLEHRLREVEVTMTVDVDETLLVRCDGNRLEQVLINLFANAIDAMQGQPLRRLFVLARIEGGRAHVQVSDTGAGMDTSVRERLFEPFFTTKPAGHGLGLGLIISAQIVREFGGHLTVGETGQGATFRFDLEVVGATADV